MSYNQRPDKQKYLDASKKYLTKIIACINDIEHGMSEIKACKKYNINIRAFRRLIFNKPLDFKTETLSRETIDEYMYSPEEMIYKDITRETDSQKYPFDLDKTIPFVMEKYLTQQEKTIMIYRYYDNITFSEIGKRINTSKQYAQQTIKSAIAKLRCTPSINILKYGLEHYENEKKKRYLYTQEYREHYIQTFQKEYEIEKNLMQQQIIRNIADEIKSATVSVEEEIKDIDKKSMSIDDLDLSLRSKNTLHRASISTVHQLCTMTQTELLDIKGLGQKSMIDIISALAKTGIQPPTHKKRKKKV